MNVLMLISLFYAFQEPQDFHTLRKQSTEAYRDDDYQTFYRYSEAARRLRPEDASGMANLAYGCALTGRPAEAMKWFVILAEMGLRFDLEDEDLASLKGTPGYEDLKKKFKANMTPVSSSTKAFSLKQRDLFPEGIAYDGNTKSFLVGSIYHRKIDRVDPDGSVTNFISAARDGMWSVLGLAVDAKRRELLACSSAIDQTRGLVKADLGKSGIFRFNLDTGKLMKRYLLDNKNGTHNLGDLTIAANGDVYASDSDSGDIYRIKAGSDELTVFLHSKELRSPQGLCFSADGKRLYLADYSYGLFAIDMKTRALTRLDFAKPQALYGLDGLVMHGNSLIGIQNGLEPNRIVRWDLDATGLKVGQGKVLEANHRLYAEPTLGTLVGDTFYFVATSQWGSYDDDNRPLPNKELKPIQILALKL